MKATLILQGSDKKRIATHWIYEKRGSALLLKYAIENLFANKVDVNEQNPEAISFYIHLGFKVVNRSPLDGQGNPFPLLHMELSKT
ncbi:GNAT family N-acetyltransferase [Alginatibacterium sediminis]|uniref:GNAT family N-acetyltransferase n=1 Tax=Alginatibacterium sediminis TaxID=2164068 RepID=A0A420EBH8_9ALTE|nr:GNAT family N-acetyltransferase [Alginatibacterium sediminis]